MALAGLVNAEYNRGRFISARQYFDACIELAREHGFGRVIAAKLALRGYVVSWQNEIARGRALAATARAKRDDETVAALRELRDRAERIGLVYALPAIAQALDADRPE